MDIESIFAVIIVTDVFLIQVMTSEFRRLCEPSPLLLTAGQAAAARTDLARIRARATTLASIDQALFVARTPSAAAVDSGNIVVNASSVSIAVTVGRVGGIETVDKCPTIRHTVEGGSRGLRVERHDVHVLTW